MKRCLRFLPALFLGLVPFVLVPFIGAQGSAASALEKFAPMLGNWEGTGTLRMTADGAVMKWTGRATAKRILGGHFVQKDAKIEMENGHIVTSRTIYGFDRERERFTAFSVGDTGEARIEDAHWTDDRKMVSARTRAVGKQLVSERFVATFGKDDVRFSGLWSVDGGPFFEHLTGHLNRRGTGFEAAATKAVHAECPISKLGGMVGDWSFKGKMLAAPGGPEIDIAARETVRPYLGGFVLRCHIAGEPTPGFPSYEGNGYYVYDRVSRSVLSVCLSNFGEMHVARGYFVGENKVVFVHASRCQGAPTAERSIMTFLDDRIEAISHRLAGVGKARQAFSGTMTRVATQ